MPRCVASHPHRPETRRRGIAAVISLIFIALLSVLSLGIYSTTHLATQTVTTQRRIDLAQLAAESGMEFARLQLASVAIPYNTPTANLFGQLAADLQTQLDGTSTLANASIEVDTANNTLWIPRRDADAIPLGTGAGAFRIEMQQVGSQLTVRSTGTDSKGQLARDIQLSYAVAMRASNIFDFGVASKGPISMNGSVSIKGTPGNDVFGSVLVVSDNNTTPLTMIGSSSISGDVSLTRVDPHSISLGSSSTIAGYNGASTDLWSHVHDEVQEPEFPTVDTTIYQPYATTIIDASSGGAPLVGGAGEAAGFVGINSLNIQNNSIVQALDSVNSPTPGSVTALGQTNGSATVNSTIFKGQIEYKTTLSQNNSTISKTKKVHQNLSFATVTASSAGKINLGNYTGPAGATQSFPTGIYYASTFSVPTGKTVEFTGPAVLYVGGAFSVSGTIVTKDDFAGNLKVRVASAAGVDLSGTAASAPLYLDLYAPQSALTITNRPKVYGSFITGSISVSNSTVIVDRAVKANGGATSTPPDPAVGTGTDGMTHIEQQNLSNVLVKANTNPKFTANTTINGVLYVERPNKVEFAGNVDIRGVVVVETDGNNNIGLDPAQNTIAFKGGVTVNPLSSLPNTSDFPAALRQLNGAFLLAPGFGVSFNGNFHTVGGSIIANQIDYSGNAGGTVIGSVIQLGTTPFTMSGNADITIQSNGTSQYPSGVFFGSRYDPLPETYVEVIP